jgi:glycosyltransferase involved in cell wall biosynthesis
MRVTMSDVMVVPTAPVLSPANGITERHDLVTAVIIFLNEERFLDEAIASVYAQTYPLWELLLVDDGSSDRSSEIARSYVERDPARVRYLEHPGHGNRGQGAARNLGVHAAHGEWIAFLDGDDVWLRDRLERSVALARAHRTVDLIYGKTEYWKSWDPRNSPHLDRIQPHYFRANRVFRPPDLLVRHLLLRAAYPCMGSLLVRRRAFLAVGGFEESFRGFGEDLMFLGKLCLRHPVYVSDECWDRYRQHSESVTAVAEAQGGIRGAQRSYLSWLAGYIEQQGIQDGRLHQALRAAIRRSDRAPDHWQSRLARVFRRAVRRRFQS